MTGAPPDMPINETKFRKAIEIIDSEMFRIGNQVSSNLARWGEQEVETLCLGISEQSGKISQAFLHSEFEPEKYKKGQILHQARQTAALCMQVAIALENQDK